MNVYNPDIENIILEPIIGLDCEFSSLDTKNALLILLSINNPLEKRNYVFDLNADTYTEKQKQLLVSKISKCNIVLAHNAKVDIAVIYSNLGVLLRNFWCTMLASQLIDNGYGYVIPKEKLVNTKYQGYSDRVYYTQNMVGNITMMPSPHGLIGCLRRYLGIELIDNYQKKRLQMSFTTMHKGQKSIEEQLDYACGDVEYLYPLYLKEQEYIKDRKQEQQVKIENTLTPVIVKMEHKGCLIDKEKQKKNIRDWKAKLLSIEQELDAEILAFADENVRVRGGQFANKRQKQELVQTALFAGFEKIVVNENLGNTNYSSNKQLRDIFERLEEPLPVDDTGKVSFAEEPLKNYITTYSNSRLKTFVNLLLDYREYSKLLSTYGESLLQLLDKDNRIRSNYTQCFTNTGRLTSSAIIKDQLGINLSNIPQNNDVRNIFIPDPGYVFIDSDMTGKRKIFLFQ